jgi:predicted Zn-dependent protease
MLTLAFLALSLATFLRAQGAEQEAVKSHALTVTRAEDVRAANRQLKLQTQKIKTDPAVKARKAQEQMRQVRRNEIVVARP